MEARANLSLQPIGIFSNLSNRFIRYIKLLLGFISTIQNSIELRKRNGVYEFIGTKVTDKITGQTKSLVILPTIRGDVCIITNTNWAREILKHRRLEKGNIFGEGRQLRVIAEAMGRYRMSQGKTDSKQKRNIMAKLLSNSQRYLPKMLIECNNLVEYWKASSGPFSINKDIGIFSMALYLKPVFNYQGPIEHIPEILESQIKLMGDRLIYKGVSGQAYENKFKEMRGELMQYLAKDEGLLSTTEYIDTLSAYINEKHRSIAQDAFETGLNGAALMGYLAPYPSFLMLVYELGKHPEVCDELRQEWNNWQKEPENPEYSYIKSEQTLLHAAIHEVLRLHPAQPFVFRKCVQDTLFNGVYIKKNSHIVLNFYHALRDKNIWGEDADRFNPQRFLNDPKYFYNEFIAYSSGPNNCSGQMFSRFSMKALLWCLVNNYRWKTVGEDVKDGFHFAMDFDKNVIIESYV